MNATAVPDNGAVVACDSVTLVPLTAVTYVLVGTPTAVMVAPTRMPVPDATVSAVDPVLAVPVVLVEATGVSTVAFNVPHAVEGVTLSAMVYVPGTRPFTFCTVLAVTVTDVGLFMSSSMRPSPGKEQSAVQFTFTVVAPLPPVFTVPV
jgi:hypothetical protein